MRIAAFALLLSTMVTAASADDSTLSSARLVNWPQFGFGPQGTRYNPNEKILNPVNVHNLRVLWTGSPQKPIESSPTVVFDQVFIGVYDTLYSFNAKTGKPRWSFVTGFIGGAPAVSGGLVYFGSDLGQLYAFDTKTGRRRWAATTSGRLTDFSSPAVHSGVVFVSPGGVQAYSGSTGDLLWTSPSAVFGCASPSVAYGRVYASCYGNTFALNEKTGRILWEINSAGSGSPAVSDGRVFLATGSEVVALHSKNGEVLWHAPTGGTYYSSPAVADGTVYVVADTELYAVNSVTGKIRWTAPIGGDGRSSSSPAVANGVVYVGSQDGTVYAFDARTGRQLWKDATTGPISSSPTIVNGVLYIGMGDGRLRAFSIR